MKRKIVRFGHFNNGTKIFPLAPVTNLGARVDVNDKEITELIIDGESWGVKKSGTLIPNIKIGGMDMYAFRVLLNDTKICHIRFQTKAKSLFEPYADGGSHTDQKFEFPNNNCYISRIGAGFSEESGALKTLTIEYIEGNDSNALVSPQAIHNVSPLILDTLSGFAEITAETSLSINRSQSSRVSSSINASLENNLSGLFASVSASYANEMANETRVSNTQTETETQTIQGDEVQVKYVLVQQYKFNNQRFLYPVSPVLYTIRKKGESMGRFQGAMVDQIYIDSLATPMNGLGYNTSNIIPDPEEYNNGIYRIGAS